MYLIKTPQFIQSLFPNFVWNVSTESKELFLTFDDGPAPEVTPWVLEQLAKYDAKATFFCLGENIVKHPELFQSVLDAGHTVGSHTYDHPDGWLTENIPYFHNVRRGASLVKSDLFRPPYGRLRPKQALFLQRHYSVVMWDVMSGDFDSEITKEQCFKNVINNAKKGSIVVFHDNLKSVDKLKYTLPMVLEHFAAKGYTFKALQNKYATRKKTA